MRSFARRLVLTLVAVALARPAAAQATAQAAGKARGDTLHPRTVAVLYFDNNTGRADYDALGRGLSAMLITDLSAVPEIRLVERERLQAVLDEQQLQRSPLFDSATAVRTGRLLGAEYLLTGSLSAIDPDMRIDTRVVRVETGEVVRTAKVQGKQDAFFDLQKRLARELVNGLPVAVSPEALERLRQQQERNRIDDARTAVDFSTGLARLDAKDYVGAVEKLGGVLVRSPDALVVRLAYDEAKRRSANAARAKAVDKAREGLRGLFKRP